MESAQVKENPGFTEASKGAESPSASRGCIRLSYHNLLWIFIIVSIAGLFLETLVSAPIDGRIDDRAGLLWGPFSPIYGSGAALMTIVLNRMYDKNLLLIFLVAATAGASFEFVVGWSLESVFGIVAWSYHDQPFSIGGHTSLSMAIAWGLIGLVWIRFVLLWVMKLIEAIPKKIALGFTVVMTVFMMLNITMTLLSFDCWFNRQAGEPVTGPVQEYFMEHYDDEFMDSKFQTMSMYTELTFRDND